MKERLNIKDCTDNDVGHPFVCRCIWGLQGD